MRKAFIGSMAAIVGTIFAQGCVPRPASVSWRLTNQVLIPPTVSQAALTKRILNTGVAADGGPCPATIQKRKGQIRLTVVREDLAKRPPGWLSDWAEGLEAQGCIAPGESAKLEQQVAQAVPMEINAAFRLLYSDDKQTIDVGPAVRFQVMTPIAADSAKPDAPLLEATTTVTGDTVTVDARATADLLGWETSWYAVRPRTNAHGVSIVPLSAERHIGGKTDVSAAPIHNYFQPLANASFYRLFYKGGQTDFTALVIGAATRADLDRRTQTLETGIASCAALSNDLCVEIPRRVGLNPMVAVTVNGAETLVSWGETVGGAIRAAGEPSPGRILPQLSISKPYSSSLAKLQFNPLDAAILNLKLMGGESISWK